MKIFVIAIFFFCLSPFWANAAPLRVQVLSKYPIKELQVYAPGAELSGVDPDDEAWKQTASEAPLIIRRGTRGVVCVLEDKTQHTQRLVIATRSSPIILSGSGFPTRKFLGTLELTERQGRLFIINRIALESYVAGVLPEEIPADSPAEALKAQAVLIRTYADKNRGRHLAEGFDFCDLTHCQVYGGQSRSDARMIQAVQGTASEHLTFQDKPADIVFHSTCGGHTSANQSVFSGKALPYLRGVGDASFCAQSPHHDWTARLALQDLEAAVTQDASLGFSGPLRDLQARAREPEGRWFRIELIGSNRVELPMERFLSLVGQQLGWNKLKSGWFELAVKGEFAEFSGHGLGHGVGLCQEGALGMARAGKSYREILAHYFPGTRVKK